MYSKILSFEKIITAITILFFIPILGYFVQSRIFAYEVTGSFLGSPGFVPAPPEYVTFCIEGFAVMLTFDLFLLTVAKIISVVNTDPPLKPS